MADSIRNPILRSLGAGTAFAIAGSLCALLFFRSWDSMVSDAAAAAFMTGTLMWRLLLWRRAKGWRARGWVTGLIIGLCSHPIAWFLSLSSAVTGQRLVTPSAELSGSAFFGGLAYSFGSLLMLGWLTVPVSLVVGAVLGD